MKAPDSLKMHHPSHLPSPEQAFLILDLVLKIRRAVTNMGDIELEDFSQKTELTTEL